MDEGVAVGSVDGDGVGSAVGLVEGMDEGSVVGMEEGMLVGNMGYNVGGKVTPIYCNLRPSLPL